MPRVGLNGSAIECNGDDGEVLEVKGRRFDQIRAEFLPRVAFGEDGVAQRTRTEAAGFVVTDFEDQFHVYRTAFD